MDRIKPVYLDFALLYWNFAFLKGQTAFSTLRLHFGARTCLWSIIIFFLCLTMHRSLSRSHQAWKWNKVWQVYTYPGRQLLVAVSVKDVVIREQTYHSSPACACVYRRSSADVAMLVRATRVVTVSTSAFPACHQCYCAGSSLGWGLNLWALECGIFWSL